MTSAPRRGWQFCGFSAPFLNLISYSSDPSVPTRTRLQSAETSTARTESGCFGTSGGAAGPGPARSANAISASCSSLADHTTTRPSAPPETRMPEPSSVAVVSRPMSDVTAAVPWAWIDDSATARPLHTWRSPLLVPETSRSAPSADRSAAAHMTVGTAARPPLSALEKMPFLAERVRPLTRQNLMWWMPPVANSNSSAVLRSHHCANMTGDASPRPLATSSGLDHDPPVSSHTACEWAASAPTVTMRFPFCENATAATAAPCAHSSAHTCAQLAAFHTRTHGFGPVWPDATNRRSALSDRHDTAASWPRWKSCEYCSAPAAGSTVSTTPTAAVWYTILASPHTYMAFDRAACASYPCTYASSGCMSGARGLSAGGLCGSRTAASHGALLPSAFGDTDVDDAADAGAAAADAAGTAASRTPASMSSSRCRGSAGSGGPASLAAASPAAPPSASAAASAWSAAAAAPSSSASARSRISCFHTKMHLSLPPMETRASSRCVHASPHTWLLWPV